MNKKVPAGHKLREDYPLLYETSENADKNERLGFYVTPLDQEIASIMHELWLARSNQKESHA